MRDAAPTTIYLNDYAPFGFYVDSVHLTFELDPRATRVHSRIAFRPDPKVAERRFFLHGEDLKLIAARIDGEPVTPEVTDAGLTCTVPEAPFVWEAEVLIDPAGNTALEGLYTSNGMYCTQCEAEGFRKITYYPDRPDVMSVFTVEIRGPHPVLLSNGNPLERGKRYAIWHDPWPKPAYLFALVAGDLLAHPDRFTTASGKTVDLTIWVRSGDEDRCAFGMEALKRSMRWDEEVYGREYDLEVFNIVAVDDFNMGAMENKGLNIFNSSAVLASPETSTDDNFERIEAIIAHEYFHNWTGNRVTCRDWFQLCLKEGLTVYRDSQFTSDMRSAAAKRISDVIDLRARQFPEDQGPLAHPVRPESFQEINNFYTATVYEKGAEVIGMLKRLVGEAAYAEALDLYFARHDGQACTIEDWLQVFQEVTGRDLSQFKRWYTQAGTPQLTVAEDWADGRLTLTFTQDLPASAATPDPQPMVIPIDVGLLGADGEEMRATTTLEMTETRQSFVFDDLPARPIPSILRGFSAPVVRKGATDNARRAFLLAHDTDPFNRWEAGHDLGREAWLAMVTEGGAPDPAYLEAMAQVARDETLEPAFRALVLRPITQRDLAHSLHDRGHVPDPEVIYQASKILERALAERLAPELPGLYRQTTVEGAYRPDAEDAGRRALNARILFLLTRLDSGKAARAQYARADNMTQKLAALNALLSQGLGQAETDAFFAEWKHDRLVMDKWFAVQIALALPERAVATTERLTRHPDFNWQNPNRFRAALGALAMNHAGFHAADGGGYALLADWLIKLDPVNPQTTARSCSAFQTWKRYDAARQDLIRTQLDRIAAAPGLSRDTTEMISRIRAA